MFLSQVEVTTPVFLSVFQNLLNFHFYFHITHRGFSNSVIIMFFFSNLCILFTSSFKSKLQHPYFFQSCKTYLTSTFTSISLTMYFIESFLDSVVGSIFTTYFHLCIFVSSLKSCRSSGLQPLFRNSLPQHSLLRRASPDSVVLLFTCYFHLCIIISSQVILVISPSSASLSILTERQATLLSQ